VPYCELYFVPLELGHPVSPRTTGGYADGLGVELVELICPLVGDKEVGVLVPVELI
jgi:hypothetical protein